MAEATLQLVVVWLLFAVVLYLGGVIFSKSKVRFWDVAAYNLFARIPFDLMLLMFAVPMVRSVMGLMTDGSVATAMEYSAVLSIVGLVALVFTVWYFYWSYQAFAAATNLRNGRGVGVFAVSFVLCYLLSGFVLIYV